MNAYTSGTQKVIPAVLLYAFSEGQVLLVQVPAKAGRGLIWNGLGGKLERGESPRDAASREFREESNVLIPAQAWRWAGQLYFPNFIPDAQQDWSVSVFTHELNAQEMESLRATSSAHPEGILQWFDFAHACALPMFEGDAQFFPLVLRGELFEGSIFYEQGKCVKCEVRAIKL